MVGNRCSAAAVCALSLQHGEGEAWEKWYNGSSSSPATREGRLAERETDARGLFHVSDRNASRRQV